MKTMQKIKIGNAEYPCRVTMGAMVRYKRESGQDVGELARTDMSGLALLMWCCVASACRADGVEFPYGFEDFADRVDLTDLTSFYAGMAEDGEKKTTGTPEARPA